MSSRCSKNRSSCTGEEGKLERLLLHCGTLLRKHLCLMHELRLGLSGQTNLEEASNASNTSADLFADSTSNSTNKGVSSGNGRPSSARLATLLSALQPHSPLNEARRLDVRSLTCLPLDAASPLRRKCAARLKLLANLFQMADEKLLALETLAQSLAVLPQDVVSWAQLVHALCRLGLWQPAAEALRLRQRRPERERAILADFFRLHQLWTDMHLKAMHPDDSCLSELSELSALMRKADAAERTYCSYRLQALCRQVLYEAAGLPFDQLRVSQPQDAALTTDSVCLLEEACQKWRTLLRSHLPAIFAADPSPQEFADAAAKPAEQFVWLSFDLSGLLTGLLKLADAYIRAGLPREADGYLQEGLAIAHKTGYINWIVQFQTRYLQLKRAQADLDKADAAVAEVSYLCCENRLSIRPEKLPAASNSSEATAPRIERKEGRQRRVLRSTAAETPADDDSVVERQRTTSLSRPRLAGISTAETCPLELHQSAATSGDQSEVFASPAASITIPTSCGCWSCGVARSNPHFALLRSHAETTLSTAGESAEMKLTRLSKAKEAFLKAAEDSIDCVCAQMQIRNWFQIKCCLPTASLLCRRLLSCSWSEKGAGRLAERAFKLANQQPLALRAHWLESRLRVAISQLRALGADLSPRPAPAADDLAVKLAALSVKSKAARKRADQQKNMHGKIDELRQRLENDFRTYGHLLIFPWRRDVCEVLAAFSVRQAPADPWRVVWLLAEAQAVALRQRARSLSYERRRTGKTEKGSDDSTRVVDFPDFDGPEQLRTAVGELPTDWTMVMLHLSQDTTVCGRVLWLVRLAAGSDPIIVPLCDTSKQFEKLLTDFSDALMTENEDSVKQSDPKTFWQIRRHLDNRIKDFVETMEAEVLGAHSAMLLGQIDAELPGIERLKLELADLGWPEQKIEMLLSAAPCLEDGKIVRLAESLAAEQPSHIVKRTVNLLREFASTTSEKSGQIQRGAVILVLSEGLHSVPWECLPLLRRADQSAITRVASAHVAVACARAQRQLPVLVDPRKAYYVLNPARDLAVTQDTFQPLFVKQQGWKGLVGLIPSGDEMKSALEENDLLVYCGHGSGGRYVGSSVVRRSRCRAVALVMGCNSVRLRSEGAHFESRGVLHEYTLANTPCMVGCLWMVTDRDIDRFFLGLMAGWVSAEWAESTNQEQPPLALTRQLLAAIANARQRCKLPYLTGAATVAYGIPVLADR